MPKHVRDELAVERLLQLNGHQFVAALAGTINPILIALAIWRPELTIFLIAWCGAGMAFSAVQFRAWLRNRHKPRPSRVRPGLERKILLGALVGGSYWGLLAVMTMPGASHAEMVVLALTVGAMGVGGAIALALIPLAAACYLLLAFVPLIVMTYLHYDNMPVELAVLTLLFFTFIGLVITRMQRTFIRAIASAVENRSLAQEARAADAAKTQFIANMSHELRTPLNAIIGYSELMAMEMFGPLGERRYRSYAGYIHDSGGHLLAIVNDMIDISRIEAGQMQLQPEPVDAAGLLRECMDLFAQRAELAGIILRLGRVDRVSLTVDRRAIRQVLFNLLSNAIKFTLGGGEVVVECVTTTDGRATLSVSDTGIGMSEKEVAVALTRFGKVASAMVTNAGGAGLGLTLSQQLLELHGGRLAITSRPGKGTRVEARLPAGTALSAAAAARQGDGPGSPNEGPAAGRPGAP